MMQWRTRDEWSASYGKAQRGVPRKPSAPPKESPERQPRPGLVRKPNEPPVPEGLDLRALHRSVRAELRGLPKELAEIVAAHLVAAGQLIDDDPELAYAHAEAARRRAARLPIVREAAAETAYAAGHYDVALSELRAIRRMTGADDFLPMMADCERALGRPEAALKLAKEAKRLRLDPAQQVEMILVEAGARGDLGQSAESLRILAQAADQINPPTAPPIALARLRYAYADALLQRGRLGGCPHLVPGGGETGFARGNRRSGTTRRAGRPRAQRRRGGSGNALGGAGVSAGNGLNRPRSVR